MLYESTRDSKIAVSSSEIILHGIAPDGGLFVPKFFPAFTLERIEKMVSMSYQEKAVEILSTFLTDYSREELEECVSQAYSVRKFQSEDTAPIRKLTNSEYVLELWHGPTHAFKDMALQLLPHLMTKAIQKAGIDRKVLILVATSGDTGKAALEGFKDVPGTQVIVFYPDEGVSNIQKLQMVTQQGDNVDVVAIRGNFDHAQRAVKEIFADSTIITVLDQEGYQFSSANSINWGRLVPQIVYYFSAYTDMIRDGYIRSGEKINIVVPTGNFGNILAAFYARKMGVPIHKLICASNSNHILTDFFQEGQYNCKRDFHKTISPSMDILISSNLERLLYEVTERDPSKVKEWMNGLTSRGGYQIDSSVQKTLKEYFWAGYADDEATRKAIRDIYYRFNYVIDPHTAVAQKVYEDYLAQTQDETKTLIAATASPFKFNREVIRGIMGDEIIQHKDEFALLALLSRISGLPVPENLGELKNQNVIHNRKCDKENIKETVLSILHQ